ncbi:MFS transporter [Enemella sp. A6]|uniref:MFS transporter n=1 Tax=Enemella sp. A6 TaxID=3440152 RepID=UPI003EBB1677
MLCAAALSAVLMQTVVMPLIPDLPAILGTDLVGASWVLTATLLTGAVAHPISGRLADIFGKRRMLLICLAVVAGGSVVSALSSSLVPMVIGRAMQGLGMGIIPIGLALMRDLLPAHRLQSGAGTLSATMGFGGALALPISAGALMYVHWSWLFWFAAVQSVLCMLLVLRVIPADPVRHRAGSMDVPGAIGFAVGTLALLVVITQGPEWGWLSLRVLGLLVAGLLVLGVWLVYQWRTKDPLVDLRLSLTPSLFWANVTGFAMGYGMFVSNLVFPIMISAPIELGYGLGLSVAHIGLLLMPSGIAMMLAGPMSGIVSRRVGPRATLQIGSVFVAVGYGLALILGGPAKVVVATVVASVGFGLTYAALPLIIMNGVPDERTGAANGLNALMRTIGLTVSGAVTAMILSLHRVSVGGADFAGPAVMTIALITAVVAALSSVVLAFGIPHPAKNAEG